MAHVHVSGLMSISHQPPMHQECVPVFGLPCGAVIALLIVTHSNQQTNQKKTLAHSQDIETRNEPIKSLPASRNFARPGDCIKQCRSVPERSGPHFQVIYVYIYTQGVRRHTHRDGGGLNQHIFITGREQCTLTRSSNRDLSGRTGSSEIGNKATVFPPHPHLPGVQPGLIDSSNVEHFLRLGHVYLHGLLAGVPSFFVVVFKCLLTSVGLGLLRAKRACVC